jgi:hypothetical protein
MTALAITYAGHTIYTDGRVYHGCTLVKQCKTLTAAKRWATIAQRENRREAMGPHELRVETALRPRLDNGLADSRYSVRLEHSGRALPDYVARFCQTVVGYYPTADAAWRACQSHAARRNADMTA